MNIDVFDLNKYPVEQGVYILTSVSDDFEDVYIKLRTKEKRIYSDNESKHLPFASDSNPHKKEWTLRAKSFLHFKEYLKTKNEILSILDIGCGNGWFCGQLSKIFNHNFFCIDVNHTELKQGKRVFNSDGMEFIYADIFTAEIPRASFNIIVINAAVQYFPNLQNLINRLLSLINEDGEIHIIDSPFYTKDEVNNARERTRIYYSFLNFAEMTERYFHHTWNELSEFKSKILYKPDSMPNRIKRLFSKTNSSFPWIVIKK